MNINGNTQLVGIIANPIGHVRTPQLFNESVSRQGLNAVCLPFHVLDSNLARVMKGAAGVANLLGLIVTIPYKEKVLEFCSELTETASLVGSANVLRIDHGRGAWMGGNFDGEGFVAGLKECGHGLQGKRVLLLGAGGAGKAIALAVARELPRELVIHNRSADRARDLADRLRPLVPQVPLKAGDPDPRGFDVVVNATSLGLKDADELPVNVEQLAPGTLVCEVVVRDGDTPLLRAARQHSCTVHHGQHMLYGQIVQISRFLGLELKESCVARILGPVQTEPH